MSTQQFSTPCRAFSLAELAEISGATLADEQALSFMISDIATLSTAQSSHLSMLHQKKYLAQLKESLAGACIISAQNSAHAPKNMHLLIHDNPYKAYALIMQALYPATPLVSSIAASAHITTSAKLGEGCVIAHGAFIGEQVIIGDRCKIGVNSYIGDGVVIGDDCCIENNVSIAHTVMGNKVVIYPGARIGQDGFGFASDNQGHYKIPHRGGVIIGNDVEIGANSCIDRGSIDNTIIGDWCRLDNLIQVGHNVILGKGCVLAALAGIAGSAELGEFVALGCKAGVSSHIKIGHHATILFNSTAIQDVEPYARVGGFPAMPVRSWHKQNYLLKKMLSEQHSVKS